MQPTPFQRYGQHMPKTDDVTLIVLKGHLLIEEALGDLAEQVLPHPEYLGKANLSFHKLACVVRAAVPNRSDDIAWELILSISSFRNDLAHNLESSQRQARLNALFEIDEQVQPIAGKILDKSGDASLSDSERLRHLVTDCMEFLLQLIFGIWYVKEFGKPAPYKRHFPR
jgi:hypothetical protein